MCWTPTLLSSRSPLSSTSCSAARRMFTPAYAERNAPTRFLLILGCCEMFHLCFFSAAHQRCLFSSRRSAPLLIVAVHPRGSRHVCVSRPRFLKPGSAFCHHPGISEKACIGVFRAGTLLSAVLRGKSPQLLFQVRSLEPDGSFAHAGACVL